MDSTLIVLAKRPVAGRVKTRLTPPCTPDEAAALAGAALRDTLDAVDKVPAALRILAFDGDPDGWLRPGWCHAPQVSGALDRRLVGAFAAAPTDRPALLVGMDTPQLQADQLTAFDSVSYDTCLGLCPDGGYWTIGFRDPRVAADAITDIPMSQSDTADQQHERLLSLGFRVQLLEPLTDVDTFADALEVARLVPTSHFAQCLAGTSATTSASAIPT